MKKRDSFLKTLHDLGITEQHEGLNSRLRMEDVVMPDMRHMVAYLTIYQEQHTKHSHDATPSDRPVYSEVKIPETSLRGNGYNPERYLSNNRRAGVLLALGAPLQVLKDRYDGLTDIEGCVANKLMSPSACVASPEKHAEVFNMVRDHCAKEHIAPPRVIVADSDMPMALALVTKDEPHSILVTSNVLETLTAKQLHAVVAHELDHVKVRGGRSAIRSVVGDYYSIKRGNAPVLKEEFAADRAAVKATDNGDHIVDALIAMEGRGRELRHCAKQMGDALLVEGVSCFSDLPAPLGEFIIGMQASHNKMLPEADAKKRRQSNLNDPHPDLATRFDKAFAEEERLRRRGGGVERDGRG